MEERRAQELLALLRPESRPELKGEAARLLLGLSGGAEGRQLLLARPALLEALLALADEPALRVARDALGALVNVSAAAPGALRRALPGLLRRALHRALPAAEQACALLANVSRDEAACRDLLGQLQRGGAGLLPLVDALCTEAALHHLGPVLCNLSRLPEGRAALLDRSRQVGEPGPGAPRRGKGGRRAHLSAASSCCLRSADGHRPPPESRRPPQGPGLTLNVALPARCVVQRLLAFTQDTGSAVRRQGVVGALRNCCFDYRHHEWLLSNDVDLLPSLLLPLAGPEEFPEDEMERLPLDLQYLSPEKQREPVAEIRKMLLEALLLLTATKPGRQVLRERGTYLILRELHQWEADPGARATCEKLIQVLISDEPEAGMENLLEVEIPAEVERQLQRLSQEEEGRQG